MRLDELRSPAGARHRRKRVGRGHGSGHVKTSGRGQKGQKARAGSSIPAHFEGGQTRFATRMPYLGGFKNPFRKEYIVVNLSDLKVFGPGEQVNLQTMAEHGLIRASQTKGMLKVLGNGKVEHALNIRAHKVSGSAKAAIEAAGGKVSLIAIRKPQTRRASKPAPTA